MSGSFRCASLVVLSLVVCLGVGILTVVTVAEFWITCSDTCCHEVVSVPFPSGRAAVCRDQGSRCVARRQCMTPNAEQIRSVGLNGYGEVSILNMCLLGFVVMALTREIMFIIRGWQSSDRVVVSRCFFFSGRCG